MGSSVPTTEGLGERGKKVGRERVREEVRVGKREKRTHV